MPYQLSLFEDNPEYEAFEEKFKPKKTTDDCYTPPYVYDVIRDWACRRYGRDPETIIRPFYPGGDYESEAYPEGCLVLDNPPFSILSQIVAFYAAKKVDFFLFGPTLTALSSSKYLSSTSLISSAQITYENGAQVPTSFVTNLEPGVVMRTVPDLSRAIEAAQAANKTTVTLPKYIYPDHVVTAAMAQRWCKYGVEYEVRREDCVRISGLDSQNPQGKTIFGGGLLLSKKAAADRAEAERAATARAGAERAAAEKAAAERADAVEWPLSSRERAIIEGLGK